MGWGIALAVVVLLAVLPLTVTVSYDAGGMAVKALAGPVTVWKTPSEKKKETPAKKGKKEKGKKESASKETKPQEKEKKPGGSLTDFLPLVQVALDFLDAFRWKLRIKRLELKLVLAGDDPCDLATNYGRIWIAVGNLIPVLERSFVIKKRDIDVGCDFTAEETLVTAKAIVSMTLGRTLALLVRYGVRALREYLKISKSRKGGAVQ